MKYSIVLFAFMHFVSFNYAQTPSISFQKSIGGADRELGEDFVQLPNGDVVICSYSESGISGDKTEPTYGGKDYWVYQISPNGTIQWQTTIGGTLNDIPVSILNTADGGFLVNGHSSSGISGNKTTATFGSFDCYIVKLSSTGQIEWQKNFGGTEVETAGKIIALPNGNYLVGATSYSNISGNKTKPSKGSADYWGIIIDDQGNIIDQFVYGGSNKETIWDVKLFNNALYYFGQSDSDISGDKNQDSYGSMDYWLVKTDLNGTIINSITEGGVDYESAREIVFSDSNLLLIGTTLSDISGSKTLPEFGFGDFWCVNLDQNLHRNWESVLGGDDMEGKFGDVGGTYSTALNQYVVVGSSLSGISGNKTINSFDMGYGDLWAVGLDLQGNKQFEFVAGGDNEDLFGAVIESNTGTLLITGGSHSGISGNKTDETNGLGDVWTFELDFNLSVQKVTGSNNLEVYPNPSTTMLNFSIPMAVNQSSIALTDLSGKVVYQESIGMTQNHQIDVTHLAKGMYILSVKADTFYYTHQVVIE